MELARTLRRAAESARWGLRAYRGSTLLMIAAAATGQATVVPALAIGRGALNLEHLPTADVGVPLSGLASTSADLQQRGLETLSGITLVLGIATAAVCIVTLVALSVARASSRRSEFVVRRAVGASRRQLLSAGVIKGGVMAVAATFLGTAVGLVAIRGAFVTWPDLTNSPKFLAPALFGLGMSAVIVLGVLLPMLTAGQVRPTVAPSKIPPGLTGAGLQLGISFAVLLAAAQIGRHADRMLGDDSTKTSGNGHVFQMDTSSAAKRWTRADGTITSIVSPTSGSRSSETAASRRCAPTSR